jgi:hypothetical protein
MLMHVPKAYKHYIGGDHTDCVQPRLQILPDNVLLGRPAILNLAVEFKVVSEPESVIKSVFQALKGFLISRVKNSQVANFLTCDLHRKEEVAWKIEEANLFF